MTIPGCGKMFNTKEKSSLKFSVENIKGFRLYPNVYLKKQKYKFCPHGHAIRNSM
jgi:hypothetical protein